MSPGRPSWGRRSWRLRPRQRVRRRGSREEGSVSVPESAEEPVLRSGSRVDVSRGPSTEQGLPVITDDTSQGPAPPEFAALGKRLARLTVVVVPPTIVVSLFFYFGWVYANRLYANFGISSSGLGFDTTDYILRSLNVLVEPAPRVLLVLLAILVLVLGTLWAIDRHGQHRPGEARWISTPLGVVALVLGLVGLVVFWDPRAGSIEPYVRAGLWLAGLLFALFGAFLLLSNPGQRNADSALRWATRAHPFASVAIAALLSALVAYALFEFTRFYANYRADSRALSIERECYRYPLATVFSVNDLRLDHLSVAHDVDDGEPESFNHRYATFRLLGHANGRYLLWPELESPREGLLVLADSDSIRVESVPQLLTESQRRGFACPRLSGTGTA